MSVKMSNVEMEHLVRTLLTGTIVTAQMTGKEYYVKKVCTAKQVCL